jgi:glutamate-5-semialdehyde dehydrogenase
MNSEIENRSIAEIMDEIGQAARSAAADLAQSSAEQRNQALRLAAAAIREQAGKILAANEIDMRSARAKSLNNAMLDRLALDSGRVEAMAAGLEEIGELPEPLGKVLAKWQRPNGLQIERISVPLGVIGIIYESRPNVTADAAGLCVKSGNAVILRGGSESFNSGRAIYACLRIGLEKAGMNPAVVQLVPTTDRDAVGYLLSSMSEYLDVVVPRGGKNLIKRVQEEARVPVIGHLEGICHVYLHESRTGICGAAETLLIDRAAAARLLPDVAAELSAAGCEIRGDKQVREILPTARVATEADWSTEYLDAIISVRVVENLAQAVEHIRHYGSGHTECIVADDQAAADQFLRQVDSAILLHNASTQFADGGEFGMGAEIGIATGRIHARGPVGAEQLTSYKYVVRGSGQTRP